VRDEMGGETTWRRFRRKATAGLGAVQTQAPAISGAGEPDAKEAEALAASLNRSAERVQMLWFSFLIFMVYLAIATGTTTHRMLFLESPLNLPVLNISLPLLGFYILTPIIFVVFHFYMLLNLVLLARTAKAFEDALVRAFPDDGEARETFRMRIENTLFVQLLVGGRMEREGINAKLLSLMALISLAVAPVALLLMIQIKFLPYHSEWITWLHRGLLTLDLLLVWTLWPGYRSGWGVRLWPERFWTYVWLGAISAIGFAYALAGATFPDEQIYLATHWVHGSIDLDLSTGQFQSRDRPKWYDWIAPVNTLDLHGEDLIDDAKLRQIIEKNESSGDAQRWVAVLSLRDRDLTEANLKEADVRHVDFSFAMLNRADLSFAWAENGHFDNAQLQRASLNKAQLQGANLTSVQLQGANLTSVQLQGASLNEAQLQGASLKSAQLQATSLNNAQLQGAELDGAQLQGAFLFDAQLQGATLVGAKLQGAIFGFSQLQGASFDFADLEGASFNNANVWRADARLANWEKTSATNTQTYRKYLCFKDSETDTCEWTGQAFDDLKRLIENQGPQDDNRSKALNRIAKLDPNSDLNEEDDMAKDWAAHERNSPTGNSYKRILAEQLLKVGCVAESAPHVVRGILARTRGTILLADPEAAKVAAAFLDMEHCPGARGLLQNEIAELKRIRDNYPLPAPKK
jgi:uncharacterized protein YjbI with pentapeptide repeats